jgi:hypothetical protein
MSDTILIYSEDDTEESFGQIVNGAYVLLQSSFLNSLSFEMKNGVTHINSSRIFLPLRGAISHGEFYADSARDIYFGKAFLDAMRWEKEQNWIGAILTPDCVKFFKAQGYQNEFLVEYDHHFLKSEKECYPGKPVCINWSVNYPDSPGWPPLTSNVVENAPCAFKSKYQNAFMFYEYCKSC